MKNLNRIILNRFLALLIGGNILFSGSSLFIISIAMHADIECCCGNTMSGNVESSECGKDCCAVTDAKFHNYVGNIRSTFQFRENLQNQFLIFDFASRKFNSKYTLYENPVEKIIDKVFIVKSELRI